jgi:hypothetical protein
MHLKWLRKGGLALGVSALCAGSAHAVPQVLSDDGWLSYNVKLYQEGDRIGLWVRDEPLGNALRKLPNGDALKDALGELLIQRKWMVEFLLQDRALERRRAAEEGDPISPAELLPDELRAALQRSFDRLNFIDFNADLVDPLLDVDRVQPKTEAQRREEFRWLLEQAAYVTELDTYMEMTLRDDRRREIAPASAHLEKELQARCNGQPVPGGSRDMPSQAVRDLEDARRKYQNQGLRSVFDFVVSLKQTQAPLLVSPLHDVEPAVQFRRREIFAALNRVNADGRHAGQQTSLNKAMTALALDDLADQGLFNFGELRGRYPDSPFLCLVWDELPLERVRARALDQMFQLVRMARREKLRANAELIIYLSDLSDDTGHFARFRASARQLSEIGRFFLGEPHGHGPMKTPEEQAKSEPKDPRRILDKLVDLAPLFNTPAMQERLRETYHLNPDRRERLSRELARIASEKRRRLQEGKERSDFANFFLGLGFMAGVVRYPQPVAWRFLVGMAAASALVTGTQTLPYYAQQKAYARMMEALYTRLSQDVPFDLGDSTLSREVFAEAEAFNNALVASIILGVNGAVASRWAVPWVFGKMRALKKFVPPVFGGPAQVVLGESEMFEVNQTFLRWLNTLRQDEFADLRDQLGNLKNIKKALGHPVFTQGGKLSQASAVGTIDEAVTGLTARARARGLMEEGLLLEAETITKKAQVDRRIRVLERRWDSLRASEKAERQAIHDEIDALKREKKHLSNIEDAYHQSRVLLRDLYTQFKFDHHTSKWTLKHERLFRRIGSSRAFAWSYRAVTEFFRGMGRVGSVPFRALRGTEAGRYVETQLRGVGRFAAGADRFTKEVWSPPTDEWKTNWKELAKGGAAVPRWKRAAHATRRTLLGNTLWTQGKQDLTIPAWLEARLSPFSRQRFHEILNKNWDRDFYEKMMRITGGKFEVSGDSVSRALHQGVVIGGPSTAVGDRLGRKHKLSTYELDETTVNILAGIPMVMFGSIVGSANMGFWQRAGYTMGASFALVGGVAAVVQGTKISGQAAYGHLKEGDPLGALGDFATVGPSTLLSPRCLAELAIRAGHNSPYNALVSNLFNGWFWCVRDGLDNVMGRTAVAASVVLLVSIGDKAGRSWLYNWVSKRPLGIPLEAQSSCRAEAELFGSLFVEDYRDPRTLSYQMAKENGFAWAGPEALRGDPGLFPLLRGPDEEEGGADRN